MSQQGKKGVVQMSKFLYIAEVYGKLKPGISKKVSSRIKTYDKGNQNPSIKALYVAVDGYEEHVKNCENYLNRELFPYLENPQGNRKPSEYVDPKHKHITADYIKKLVEERITNHPLKVLRLKESFLPITRFNAKTIEDGIRHFPNKYLELI